MLVIQKPHQTSILVTTRSNEWGRPTTALGIFLFSRYSRGLHFSSTFSAAKKHERNMKSQCYQTAAITTKWVHKWPADESQTNGAPNRDPKWCRDKGAGEGSLEFKLFWKDEGKCLTLPSQSLYKRPVFMKLFFELSCGSSFTRPCK